MSVAGVVAPLSDGVHLMDSKCFRCTIVAVPSVCNHATLSLMARAQAQWNHCGTESRTVAIAIVYIYQDK